MRKLFFAASLPVIFISFSISFSTVLAQNVGIGITAPEYRLHVNGDPLSAADVFYSKNNFVGAIDVIAVTGYSVANPGYGLGVQGIGGSIGVLGLANATNYSGTAYGVRGTASGTAGTRIGLYGSATGVSGATWAGYFASGNVYIQNKLGIGTTDPSFTVQAIGSATTTGFFENTFSGGNGVIGLSSKTAGAGVGVGGYGGNTGVYGQANEIGTGNRIGLNGIGSGGTGDNYGVKSSAGGGTNAYGIYVSASGASTANWAGYFADGNVYVGDKVGIGTNTPLNPLEVAGKIKATNLQITAGASAGYVLLSDLSGNASWNALSSWESDPQVGTIATNYHPKWNGSALVTSTIYEDVNGLGIGTAAPLYPLDVISGKTRTANFINTAVNQQYYGAYASCYNTPDYGFGMVGYGGSIGVYGNASLAGGTGSRKGLVGIAANGLVSNYGVWGSASGGSSPVGIYGEASGGSTANFAGYFGNGNVYVQNSVGIGTQIPSLSKLQVQGAVGNTVAMFSTSANSQGISIISNWPGINFNSYYNGGNKAMAASGFPANISTDQNVGGLTFATTSVANTISGSAVTMFERMRISGAGYVGIGTINPTYPLDVSGNLFVTGNFTNTAPSAHNTGVVGSCSVTPGFGFGVKGYGGIVGVHGEAPFSGAGARVGVEGFAFNGATNNYGMTGQATGGANAFGLYGAASGAPAGHNWAGYFDGAAFCTAGVWTGSDRKLKNDIHTLFGALAIIDQLKPSVYTFKTNEFKQMNLPEGLQYGLIADEVKLVMPGAVMKTMQPAMYENHDEKHGKKLRESVEFNAVNYTEMIPILIAAVKEQQAIIGSQEIKMADLQKELNDIKAALKK
ncbi:MAG: tail fiber domain-containing protein [Bacteroidota bacterium]